MTNSVCRSTEAARAGDSNLFFSQNAGTSTSINASVPMNGNPIYMRLWTLFGGVWPYADYTYPTIVS